MNKRLVALIIVIALCTSLGSMVYQRPGDIVKWCNTQDDGCPAPQLTGGYPVGYWRDQPGVSVENSLGPEDEWALGLLAANTGIHAVVLGAIATLASGLIRRSSGRGG